MSEVLNFSSCSARSSQSIGNQANAKSAGRKVLEGGGEVFGSQVQAPGRFDGEVIDFAWLKAGIHRFAHRDADALGGGVVGIARIVPEFLPDFALERRGGGVQPVGRGGRLVERKAARGFLVLAERAAEQIETVAAQSVAELGETVVEFYDQRVEIRDVAVDREFPAAAAFGESKGGAKTAMALVLVDDHDVRDAALSLKARDDILQAPDFALARRVLVQIEQGADDSGQPRDPRHDGKFAHH